MTARLVIRIGPDGTITAETSGLTGDACVPFAAVLEDLCDATAVQSEYTADYWAVATDATAAQNEVEHRDDT